jgi:hypothetical protein
MGLSHLPACHQETLPIKCPLKSTLDMPIQKESPHKASSPSFQFKDTIACAVPQHIIISIPETRRTNYPAGANIWKRPSHIPSRKQSDSLHFDSVDLEENSAKCLSLEEQTGPLRYKSFAFFLRLVCLRFHILDAASAYHRKGHYHRAQSKLGTQGTTLSREFCYVDFLTGRYPSKTHRQSGFRKKLHNQADLVECWSSSALARGCLNCSPNHIRGLLH